jgi:methylase of polypeptide subunit release factors
MHTEVDEVLEQEFKFLKVENIPLKLFVSNNLFIPNKTTQTIADAVQVNTGETGIELGAGTGPLTVLIASRPIAHLYSVEKVREQYLLAKRNVEKYDLANKVTLYEGNIFDPIEENHSGLKVDFIVSDISGMAEEPGRALGWYPPSIPTGGDDGTNKIIPLIEQATSYLKENGRLYFPVVANFSDADKILRTAEDKFASLEKLATANIPLTGELLSIVDNLKSGLYKQINRQGSRGFWQLDVYKAAQPKK